MPELELKPAPGPSEEVVAIPDQQRQIPAAVAVSALLRPDPNVATWLPGITGALRRRGSAIAAITRLPKSAPTSREEDTP